MANIGWSIFNQISSLTDWLTIVLEIDLNNKTLVKNDCEIELTENKKVVELSGASHRNLLFNMDYDLWKFTSRRIELEFDEGFPVEIYMF